jgi:pimeloyl-ACP methyl ester carboxylesterase
MRLRLLQIPVDGGKLRVLVWGTGKRVAVGLHGITASAMSWQAVARHMPADWTLAAPDLRGRGHSSHLPGPYGLDRHAADVTAVLRHFNGSGATGRSGITGRSGARPVLAGHSMGAYVALLARDAHPELTRRLVLVDGALPLPVPDGIDLDTVLEASLGPALATLGRTFPDTEAYLDFWKKHPALAGHWTADVEAYVRYDLTGEPGRLRSRAAEEAVRADGRDVLTGKPFEDALFRLKNATPLLTAPAGMFGQPPGMLPPETVASWQERVPQLRPVMVPGVNNYTIMFDRQGAATVARAITTVAR